MDFLEELVMWNLGARYPGELFFCPQFDINDGWGCPDFLVLYPRESQVWVVEVSGAANPENLAVKVKNKEKQWLEPLRQRLPVKFPMVSNRQIGVKVFIRRDSESTFRRAANPLPSDVELFILEELGFPWEAWGERLQPRGGN